MTVSRDYQVYPEDMLAATGKALSFVSGLDEHSFASNEEKVFAVIHALEIIGEAAKHIPPEIQEQYPDIPWRAIAGTRDKLIHAYFEIHLPRLWATVHHDLPVLEASLTKILMKTTDDPEREL
jgi:uncharacterized protein with HEPN domain